MGKFTRTNQTTGTSSNRHYFFYLFAILCFMSVSLDVQAGTNPIVNPIGQPGVIPVITGPDTVCIGAGEQSYATEAGMLNYEWTVSPGGTIISGNGTNSVVVTWELTGNRQISAMYSSASSPGTLDVNVIPIADAAIAIMPDNNPVCDGTSVTFTATVQNGGSTPVFQWMVNGVPVGANNPVFSYSPSNGDVVTCTLASNAPCIQASPVVSAPVTMIINQSQQAAVFIYPSSNPVCEGSIVTFSAVPQNGGAIPVYQWKVNGINAGVNAPSFSAVPLNGDAVACEMTSSSSCVTGNPVVSNTVNMTVGQSNPVAVSITPSVNPVCQGNPVVFTAQPVNGGSSPQYLWKVNNIPAGATLNTFSYTPAGGDIVTCQLTSNISCAVGNPAVSSPVTMTVNSVVPVSLSIQASVNPVCQGSPVTFTATPVNGGGSPVYQWMLNGFPVGANSATYSFIPANGDAVSCKLYSSLICPDVNPSVSNTVTMGVTPNIPISVSISASANPVCVSSPVTLSANVFNGGTSPVFEWRVNGTVTGTNSPTCTFVPNNGDQVVCYMTSNASCAPATPVASNQVTMTVSPQLPASLSVVPSASTVCQNMQVVFTAIPSNGGTSPAYQWQVNGTNAGTSNSMFTYSPQDGDQVKCIMTSNLACVSGNPAVSNVVPMTVIPSVGVPVSVVVTPSANPSCIGQTVTFTASVVNGGISPVYAWTLNGLDVGTNSPTYTYIPLSGDFVRCWVTSDLSCATNNPASSNEVLMSVSPILPVSVSIISSANPSCLGSPVTYTATGVNPGLSPTYQWKVDGVVTGTNQNTLVYSPVNSNVITCKMTSSLGCSTGSPATSNAITMVVLQVLPVTVTISTVTNPSCTGAQVTYHAFPTNGGSAPAYQWKKNSSIIGANSATLVYIPANGDVFTCRLTSNALCYSGNKVVTSAPLTQTVSSELIPVVSIAASANPFCEGSSVTFSATPANGGTIPVYQWQVNCVPVGTTNSTYTYTPVDGDFVTCQMTSNLVCAINNPCKSNAISMKRNNQTPAGIQVTASANPVCPGAGVTFSSSVVNGGTTPVYQWRVNGTNAGTNSPAFTYNPASGDVVTCKLTSNMACVSGSPAYSNAVTMGTSASIPAAVLISTLTNPFCTGSSVNFSAIPTNGGTAPFYQWKVNGAGAGTNSTLFSYTPAGGDVVQCSLTSNATCISGPNPVTSNQLTMLASSPVPAAVSIASTSSHVCQGTAVTFTATHSGGGESPVFVWKVNGNATGTNNAVFTYTPANGDVVNCTLSSSLSCASSPTVVSNDITLTVDPSQPVAVTIIASLNPCCAGSPVTFNATVQNGGTAPVYQWIVNCVNVGTSSPDYTYVPVNGDVVVCQVLSNADCAAGNPMLSNNINMVVLPVQPVSVTITPNPNPFCVGNAVTFTADPFNGGTSPVYQWQINHINVGTNSSVYTYPPANGDTVTCVMTSNAACTANNPATSGPIVMIGNSSLPVTITIVSQKDSICQTSTPIQFTATTTNAGNNASFLWKINGILAANNSNVYTYSYPPNVGDVVTCTLLSALTCASPNPAVSNELHMTVYPTLPVSATVTPSANPVCVGSSVTFSTAVVNGGTNPTYRWYKNGTIVFGATQPTYTITPVNGDVVYCRVSSNLQCKSGSPYNSNQVVMIVSPNAPASVSIAPSANPVCAGTAVVFTATPYNGGTAPVYQWKVNGVNSGTNSNTFSYAPVNGDIVNCEMTSNSMCTTILNATSNHLVMTVSAIQPVSISVLPSVNPVCLNSYVTYTAVPVNGGAAPQYQWKVNGVTVGSNSQTYTYIPNNSDIITCKLTSGLSCTTGNPATSPPVNMTVSASLPVSISVSSSTNPSCQGQLVDYTANPVNGGINPVYQWMVNGINVGANAPTYTHVPAQGDYVNCQLTSDFSCATGNPALATPVVATVIPNMPTAISIVSSGNPVCSGTAVSYTATGVNGGSSPVYQWKVNGINAGSNSPLFSYTPVNGDTVICQMTSDIACPSNNPTTSNPIVMNVVQPASAAVTVTASQNPTCQGSPVTFTASPVNGGSDPGYQWKVNGMNTGTGIRTYTMTPVDGDVVLCEMTSNAACINAPVVQSLPVVMTVSTELPVSLTIAPSANPVCLGQPVLFTANVVNGGILPVFQWSVNGINVGANSPFLNFTPSNGDVIECLVTSDFSCAIGNPASSNAITMAVTSAIPAAISIAASANPVCLGSAVTITASFANAGNSPVFQWKVNGNNAGANQPSFTYIPANGDVVACHLISDNPCSNSIPVISNQVVMVVSTDLPVNVTISGSASQVCAGTSVSYTASSENGGAAPVYQWKVNGNNAGTNSAVFSYIPADGDQVTCVLTSALSCATGNPASSNVLTMNVYTSQAVSVAVVANPPGEICAGSSVLLTAMPSNGGSSPVYQWYKNGNPAGTGQSTFGFIPSNGDQVYVVISSNLPCSYGSPAASQTVTLVVANPVIPGVSIGVNQNSVCEGTPVTFTATPLNGGTPGYQWHLNGTSVGSNQDSFTCVPVNGDQVYVTLTSGLTCVTSPTVNSNTITMAVTSAVPVNVGLSADQNPVCQGTPVTFTATPVNGGNAGFQWFVNLNSTGTNQPSFSYIPSNGDLVHVVMTSDLGCVVNSIAVSNYISMVVNQPLVPAVGISASQNPVCLGLPVTFTATPVNGGSPTFQWFKNNVAVGTNQDSYTCIPADGDQVRAEMTTSLTCVTTASAISNNVVMTVHDLVPVSVTVSADQNNVCEGTLVTFTANGINGGSPVFQWFKNDLPVGSGTTQYSCIPLNGDRISAQLTSSVACANPVNAMSNVVEMVVNPALPVSVAISASATNVCQGTTVSFTATAVNGGTPTYQWYKNGVPVGTNQAAYSYIPANGDVIHVEMTSGLTCVINPSAISNSITMLVNQPLVVSVNNTVSQNPVCQGTAVTFTATPVNGGTPAYQWYRNNLPVGINQDTYSYIPADGDQVRVEITSGLWCVVAPTVTSNTIVMSVGTLMPVSVAVSASQNNVCQGTSVTFTATGINGGSPVYAWFKNGLAVGTNNAQYTYNPANGDQVYVEMTSTITCPTPATATSNVVAMMVNAPLPVSVSIVSDNNNVCAGTSVTYTATPVNGGTPTYQWYKNSVAVGSNQPVYSCVPLNGDAIHVEMTSSLACVTNSLAASNIILTTVNQPVPVSVTVSVNQNPVCAGTEVMFTASAVNGGSPTYQWYKNNIPVGFNQNVYSCFPADGDMVYVEMSSSLSCISAPVVTSNTISMTVNPLLPVSVTVTESQNNVCEGTAVVFEAVGINGGNAVYQWYKNGLAVGTNSTQYSCVPINGDQVYVGMTSDLTCISPVTAVSNVVTMDVNTAVAVEVSVSSDTNNVCAGTLVTFTATPVNGGVPVYQWYRNGSPAGTNQPVFACVPENGDEIHVELTTGLTCVINTIAISNSVIMVVNQPVPVAVNILASQNPVCQGSEVTFNAAPVNGGTPVYQWFKNGVPVGGNLSNYSCIPANGDEVHVKMTTSLTCVMAPVAWSDTIKITVNAPLTIGVSVISDKNEVCQGTPVSLTALPVNGGIAHYQWYNNDVAAGEDSSKYSFVPVSGDRVYVKMTTSLACVNATNVTSNTITPLVKSFPAAATAISGPAAVCAGTQGVVYSVLPVAGATDYTWIVPAGMTVVSGSNESSVTVDFNGNSLAGGINVYGNNACGSGPSSPSMAVAVNPVPVAPVITREWNTFTSSVASGNQWYFEGTAIPDSTGQTISPELTGWYWSVVSQNGCNSDTSNHIYYDGFFPGPVTDKPGFWVYPVPNDGHFTVAISLPAEDVFDITVFNSLGMQIFEIPGIVVKNKFKRMVDLRPRLPKGLFTVVFKCDDYQVVKKVLIYNR